LIPRYIFLLTFINKKKIRDNSIGIPALHSRGGIFFYAEERCFEDPAHGQEDQSEYQTGLPLVRFVDFVPEFD